MSTETITLPKPGTYTVDPAHAEAGFVARHLIGTKVRGRFTEFSGTFTVAENPEDSTFEAEAKVASIDTNQSMRDDHLRTNDFFDAENYPTITIKSTGLKRVTDAEWKLVHRPHHSWRHQAGGVRPGIPGRGSGHAGRQDRGGLLRHRGDRPP